MTRENEYLSVMGMVDEATVEPTPAPAPIVVDVDPHTMTVKLIQFDPADVAEFDLTQSTQFADASRKLFAKYKSPKKDPDRNSHLHQRISQFLGRLRLEQRSGGHIKEHVKATKEQRDMAALLASKGITMDQLLALVGPNQDQEGTETES